RQFPAFDVERRRFVGGIELEMTAQSAVGDALRHVLEPYERRDRYLDPRRNVLPSDQSLGPASFLADLGAERDTDAGLAVAVTESTDLELTDRDEATQAQSAPFELGRL